VITWRTSLAVAVLGASVGLLAAGAPAALVAAAPVVGALYAVLFMTGTRFFQWVLARSLFKD
jgi:hypothetical protein